MHQCDLAYTVFQAHRLSGSLPLPNPPSFPSSPYFVPATYISADTRSPSSLRLGFLGLGIMGTAMATRLLNAGHSLAVWNRSADKCAPLVALGAR